MKVRTFLLFACMIVVPGLAMFSHRVPPELRTATRCAVWDPIVAWAEGWFASRPGEVEELSRSAPDARAAGMAESEGLERSQVPDLAGRGSSGAARATPLSSSVSTARLATLGATAVECRPLDAQAGSHVASCRVPMDASGQLHRVFQAAGLSPGEAVAALADQVEDWQARLAARAPVSGGQLVR